MKSPFKDLPREVAVLSSVAFLVAVGFGVIAPAIPLFARSFGVSQAAAGAVISIFAAARFSSGLLCGKMVNSFGERKVLATGLFMVGISSIAAGLADTYLQLIIFRTAGGLGSAMFTVASTSLLLGVVSDDQRGRAQSIYQGGFLFGGITGPLFGGILCAISLRAPFFVYAGGVIAGGIVTLIFLHKSEFDSTHGSSASFEQTTIREAIRMHPYQVAVLCSIGTGWAVFGMRNSLIPLFVTEGLGRGPAAIGAGMAAATLMQGLILLPAGRFVDKQGRRKALLIGISVTIIGVFVFAFFESFPLFLIGMGISGIGGAFLGSAPAALVGDIIRGRGGKVVALWQMGSDFGMIVGPITLGFIADHVSYKAAFLTAALIFLPALIRTFNLPETRKSHLPAVYEP